MLDIICIHEISPVGIMQRANETGNTSSSVDSC